MSLEVFWIEVLFIVQEYVMLPFVVQEKVSINYSNA
jgi:hypothetical protein